jgi:hypothetical protein
MSYSIVAEFYMEVLISTLEHVYEFVNEKVV